MKNVLFILVLALVFVSCTNTKSENIVQKVIDEQEVNKEEVVFTWDDFGEIRQIEMKELFSVYAAYSKIKVLDSLIFFSNNNNDNDDPNLLLITNQKGDTLKTMFPKGKGPNELGSIHLFDFISDSLMFFYDGTVSVKVAFYKTDDILHKENPKPIKSLNFGKSTFRLNAILNNNKFIGNSYFSQEKIIVIDSFGNNLNKIGGFHFLKDMDVDEAHCLYLNTSYVRHCNVKPNNEKYIVAFMSTDLIEIYDTNGVQTFVGHGPDGFCNDKFDEKYLSGENLVYSQVDSSITYSYYNIQTNDDNIFVSYKGKNLDEEPLGMHYILVFDWNGNPVTAFYIDEPFTYYYIDFKNKFIYTYNYNTEKVCKAKLDF